MITGLVSLCLVAFWAAFTGNLIASLAGKERYSQEFYYSSIHLQVNSGYKVFIILFPLRLVKLINIKKYVYVFILVYTPKLPIESLEELAESKVYLPLIEAGTVPHTLFRVNTLPIYF